MLGVRTFAALVQKLSNVLALMNLLIANQLIHLGKCSKCRRGCVLTKHSERRHGFARRCPKCRKFFPLFTNSFFDKSSLSLTAILQVLYCWVNEISQKQCVDLTGLSRPYVNQLFRYARDICSWKIIEDQAQFQFGAEGVVVQIDESIVTKRKHHKGKAVRQRWVLGIYDTSLKKGLVVYVRKRNADTMIPIIQKFVKVGTEIWNDEWRAYRRLASLGYIHRTVNHSKNLKNPDTGVCTNVVEGFWAVMKKSLRRKNVMNSRLLEELIDEFMWRKVYLDKRCNPLDVFLSHVKERYPGPKK